MPAASWRGVLLGVVVACAATVCSAQSGDIPRPGVKVGDTWTYTRTTNSPVGGGFRQARAVQVNDKAIQLVITDAAGKESDETYTPDWNVVASAFGIFYPNIGLFQFPLKVGAGYAFQFEVVPALATNVRTRHEHTAKVVGWEEVQVPAGKYRAVKVEARGTWRRLDISAEGTAHFVMWYVPELRRWARFSYDEDIRTASGIKPAIRVLDELIAFKLE
jgi:hypothetical protein